jgi:putative N-acetylmannosamine-6-phosphate epimerase
MTAMMKLARTPIIFSVIRRQYKRSDPRLTPLLSFQRQNVEWVAQVSIFDRALG